MGFRVKKTGRFPRDVSDRMKRVHLKNWFLRDGLLEEQEYQDLLARVK